MTQWSYTTPVVTSINRGRITSLNLLANGDVAIHWEIGELASGTFTPRTSGSVRIAAASIPGAMATTIATMFTRAYTYLNGQGILPAGTEV